MVFTWNSFDSGNTCRCDWTEHPSKGWSSEPVVAECSDCLETSAYTGPARQGTASQHVKVGSEGKHPKRKGFSTPRKKCKDSCEQAWRMLASAASFLCCDIPTNGSDSWDRRWVSTWCGAGVSSLTGRAEGMAGKYGCLWNQELSI
jgi:hypothetical protein